VIETCRLFMWQEMPELFSEIIARVKLYEFA